MKKDNNGFFPQTPRDLRILHSLCQYGALTAIQISVLWFPLTYQKGEPYPQANCQVRLKKLREGGYIERIPQAQLLTEGRKPYLYRLTAEGRRSVAAWLHQDLNDLPCKARD